MQTLSIMLPKVAFACHSYGKLVCCYQSGLQDKSTAREKDEDCNDSQFDMPGKYNNLSLYVHNSIASKYINTDRTKRGNIQIHTQPK